MSKVELKDFTFDMTKLQTIYEHFFADYDEGRIVIAHAGEHLVSIDTPKL